MATGTTFADIWRIYAKPSMDGRLITRKKGVIRRSEKVKKVNERFAAAKPASKCKGLPWKKFVACLRENAPKGSV